MRKQEIIEMRYTVYYSEIYTTRFHSIFLHSEDQVLFIDFHRGSKLEKYNRRLLISCNMCEQDHDTTRSNTVFITSKIRQAETMHHT